MQYLGDFPEDATVYIPFNTFSSDDPQASVTITNLVDADLKVHKDGSTTQIVTDGATIAIDFDTITGNHLATIDTSAHSDYEVGSDYIVRMEGTTVDGGTINAWIGSFSIENRFNEVDVTKWLGTAAATPTTAGVPEVDVTHWNGAAVAAPTTAGVPEIELARISGQTVTAAAAVTVHTDLGINATAQGNLEDQYDTTGLTGDTFPSTQSQLSGIANVGSAVHRPASSYTLTTGTQSANTVASTESLDGTRHEHTDTAGVMSLEYHFLIGSGAPSSIQFTGYVTGNNDDIDVFGYDWVTAGYKQIGNIQGLNSTDNNVKSFDLFVDMVGSGGDLGKVDIKFEKASGLTSALLAIDQIFVAFSEGEGGYVDGIEVDTNASNENTVPGIDGVKGNPVSTWAAALTLSASTGIKEFKIINGSAIALSANSDNYTIRGQSYTLGLGIQSIASIYVFGATVTGTGTGSGAVFEDCPIGDVTLPPSVMRRCYHFGIITNSGTGDWFINDPRSRVAGSGSPGFNFGTAIGDTNLNIRANSGGWQLEAMGDTGTDVASIEGWGQIIEGACTGGTVTVRGNFTTSGFTNLTLSDVARFDSVQLVDDFCDEIISKAEHNVPGSLAKLIRQGSDLVQIDGVVSDASPAVGDFDTNLTQPDGYFDDAVLIFSNGAANAGIGRPVVTHLNANGNMSFLSPDDWPVTPINGDDFVIYATHVHPVGQISSQVMTDLDSNGSTVIDELTTQGDTNEALISALNDIASADVLTQVNAALDTAIAELAVAAPTATPTLRTGLMLLYMMARNRVDVDTTGTDAVKVYNDAGTQIASKTITDDGADYSEAKMS